jgi:voltage-gated potassium channel
VTVKDKLHQIIFEADTKSGKLFDIVLLWLIIASVATVLIDSVSEIHARYYTLLIILEWIFTIAFTIEYVLRLWVVNKPMVYAKSFFGIIDLLSILPTYASLFIGGSHYLVVIRALRLLRVFRILKLVKFSREGMQLLASLRRSMPKIIIFLAFVLTLVTILGSMMYMIEGASNQMFTSIPKSIYWAIVTLTTVGYGDITPQTGLGQLLAAIIMLLGYAIIAVPTGIVSADIIKSAASSNTQSCQHCGHEHHEDDAIYCKKCGGHLGYENET